MALAPADLSAIVAKSSNGNEAVPQGQGHIWVILGPAGCGKTTVATHLSEELSLPYLEGDKVRGTHQLRTGLLFMDILVSSS